VFAIFTALIRRNSDNFGNDCDVLERKIGGELGIIEVNWVFYYLKNKNNRCTCDHALLFVWDDSIWVWIICGFDFEACFSNIYEGK
jgi:hypothetical protein